MIRAWIAEHDWQIIPFNGEEIVAGIAAIAAIDHFTVVLMQQRKAKRGLQINTSLAPAIESNGASTAAEPEPVATAEPETKPERTRSPRLTMSLPRGYSSKVARTTRTSLERALPQALQLQLEYLEQIVAETDKGKAFLHSIAEAMVKKYGGDKARNMANLLEMAKKIQTELATAKE